MIKTVLILVVVAIAIVLAYAATRPDTFHIERSADIKAPPEKLFPLINDLRAMGTWSPYEKKDPQMKRSFSGAATGKGQVYDFEGNKEVGSGRLEILDASAPQTVVMKLDMFKPFNASNTVTFKLQPKGDTTRVTWGMDGASPYLAKVMHLFFNMDAMVGGDFEKGLANLKSLAEQPART